MINKSSGFGNMFKVKTSKSSDICFIMLLVQLEFRYLGLSILKATEISWLGLRSKERSMIRRIHTRKVILVSIGFICQLMILKMNWSKDLMKSQRTNCLTSVWTERFFQFMIFSFTFFYSPFD